MSTTDAARSEAHSRAARIRWREAGDPVLTRSVQTVVTRSADLSGSQKAAIEAAIEASQETES
jgi:hypothetical protein